MSKPDYQAYDHSSIEKKWQDIWEKDGSFEPKDDFSMPKFYGLIEFPYPSGNGLHVGHPRSYTAMDIICRKRRMEGYNVLFPIGWDAFGLPTENYAIKNKIHPEIVTKKNIEHFKQQLKMLGFSFTWSSEISTTDPEYYHFTQWIFLKLFENGLAYKAEMPINWCTNCKVGLANEEVVNGVCERCGGEVVRKVKSQWMLRITEYAEKLIEGLDTVDFIEKVKIQQRNWIGRSTGAEVDFNIKGTDDHIRVYTTRPDTLFGATYMVISPEHKLIEKYKDRIQNYDAVSEYRAQAAKKSEFERTELAKEKTGAPLLGLTAINPVNNKEIPIWTSDYVLSSYGTGAIMAVPAHDDRDYEFAKKFGIDIIEVVSGGDISAKAFTDIETGTMVNSGFLNGLSVKEAKESIIRYLEEQGIGKAKVNYKLRDWVFSRQRYWGEPIPVVNCEKCGFVALPESDLPLILPEIDNYVQTDSGESPLVNLPEWVNTTCPHCGGPARRETDTMPQWAGSSWYFIRYTDPHNPDVLASWDKMKYWLPVDWYNGGMEHTTLHLLYSRFWHKFLFDIGAVPCPEPYQKRTSHGMILGENGEKMSKSRGNVINPDDIVKEIGADAFRLYEMFMGAFDQPIPWSTDGARGCYRFLERVWKLQKTVTDEQGISQKHARDVHMTIKKVSEDYEKMKFNTAIAAMMSLVNVFYSDGSLSKGDMAALLKLLYPVCPHFCEELWQILELSSGMIHSEKWPVFDGSKLALDETEIAVQILGKIKLRINVPSSLDRDALAEYVLTVGEVKELIGERQVRKVIAVPGSLVNIIC